MALQLIDRAVTVLHALGGSGEAGLRLIDVQRATGMSKPAAHRLLQSLVGNGFAALDPGTLRYRLGRELAVLAWSVAHRDQDLRAAMTRSAIELADETGDTVFVSVRSGFDAVCVDRCSGTFPIKALTVDIGTRRPLGIGVTGLSMLAALPVLECDEALEVNASRLGAYNGITVAQLRAAVRETQRRGYALSNGLFTESVRSVAVAIRDFRGAPVAAIGVAAILARIPQRRVPELAALLERERRRIESRLLAGHSTASAPAARPVRRARQASARAAA
jgi:DNA-binding IclR family transcriptional regulator